ncbi:MAG: tRNA pseudouridine(54/55) synthase Pus10 [Candidatus Micrarchaeia archaeon]
MDFRAAAQKAKSLAQGIEYRTFSTSVEISEETGREFEESLRRDGFSGKLHPKTLANRALRGEIERETGKVQDKDGDVRFTVDAATGDVSVSINPLFLLCKYRKLDRLTSQTRWEKYESSVEGYIVRVAEEICGCTNAFLHGAGREDVDVRMLGGGRLCVVEIEAPRTRKINLQEFGERVREVSGGKVELDVLREVPRQYVWIVKEGGFDKEYDAEVEFAESIGDEGIRKIEKISQVMQETPKRVMHRRADKVRERQIRSVVCTWHEGRRAKFIIRTEAGTYIKELISGDGGRTVPSFASVAGCAAKCTALDVINVHEHISDWW